MEIPVINRISDFGSLQNPSLLSPSLSVPKISYANSIWKWGAVIIAIVASFTTVVSRIKILVLRLQRKFLLPSPPLLQDFDEFDCSTDDETCSASSLSDYEEDDPKPSCSFQENGDVDYRVAGLGFTSGIRLRHETSDLRRRRSIGDLWSEFTSGKSVVKLWDNLGLGLDFDHGNAFSFHDFPASSPLPVESSGVILTATSNEPKNAALRVWDTRLGCSIPAILAEWRPQIGKIIGVNCDGAEKVYLRDDSGKLTVGDLRNLSSPLGNLRDSDVEKWWDADADEHFNESSVAVTRL